MIAAPPSRRPPLRSWPSGNGRHLALATSSKPFPSIPNARQMVEIFCVECRQPITGRVLQWKRANCCEPCYALFTGAPASSVNAEVASGETAARRQALLDQGRAERQRIAKLHRLNTDPMPQTKQYMVLTQYDSFFSGSFSATKIAAALNHYASLGWTVVSATTGSIVGGFVGGRDELIVILERPYYTATPQETPPAEP